jgi:hypothetical protein
MPIPGFRKASVHRPEDRIKASRAPHLRFSGYGFCIYGSANHTFSILSHSFRMTRRSVVLSPLANFDYLLLFQTLARSIASFCPFLHLRKTQPYCFQAIPYSLPKHPGYGGAATLARSEEFPGIPRRFLWRNCVIANIYLTSSSVGSSNRRRE